MPNFTPKSEGQHAGEFILSEFPVGALSRESGTVASGQNLVDGQVVQLSGDKLVAKDSNLDTEGNLVTAPEGIVIGNWNASSTGPYGATDLTKVPYIKRLAEVKDDLVTWESGSGAEDAVKAALAADYVIPRDTI